MSGEYKVEDHNSKHGCKLKKKQEEHISPDLKDYVSPLLSRSGPGLIRCIARFLSQNGKAADNGSIVKLSVSIDKNQLILADI